MVAQVESFEISLKIKILIITIIAHCFGKHNTIDMLYNIYIIYKLKGTF